MEAGAGKRSGSGSNIFYSFDLGLTHFISFSAEAYAYRSGAELLANQLAFMTADLAAVDRSVTPWVVALVHKDWYDSKRTTPARPTTTPPQKTNPNPNPTPPKP